MNETEMPRTLDQVIAQLPDGERAKIEVRGRELIAEEMAFRSVRDTIGNTETAVANGPKSTKTPRAG